MLVELLTGGVLVAVGVLIGWKLPVRRRSTSAEPRCGCGHALAFHDPKQGVCHWVKEGVIDTHHCGCRQYTGPQPLPEYYAPEVSG